MQTNSTHGMAASVLSEVGSLDSGTLAFITVHKKGETRGKGTSKQVYGDDIVHVLVWTGFSYEALVQRAIKKLEAVEGLHPLLLAEAQKIDPFVTLDDVCLAVQELRTSLYKVVSEPSGRVPATPEETDSVWEPLIVDGTKIRGSKVYVGKGDPTKPGGPKPGTIYVDGVKLGQVTVTPAPNGHWKKDSKSKTVVKEVLKDMLPVGLYVRYSLEPDRVLAIKVGKDASAAAVAAGIPINPEAIRSLFKVAP